METVETKSTHKVEVVEVKLDPHPNADALSIVRVFGYVVCVRSADWKDGDLGAYVVPDSLVDVTRPEFSFLRKKDDRDIERIRVMRLRGMMSQGFLCPAPEGSKVGDDVAEQLGVERYEPPEPTSSGGDAETPPEGFRPKYDVDAWHRYSHLFEEGETVIATEKLHGSSARFTYQDDRMWAGSRREWRKEPEEGKAQNYWWTVLKNNDWIEEWCRMYPTYTLYGEVFGKGIQELHYGLDKPSFRVFDIWHNKDGRWLNWYEVVTMQNANGDLDVNWVPLVYVGIYDAEKISELAEGKTKIHGADHIREGVVLSPVKERYSDEIGRVKLKIVGNGYLEKK